MVPSNPGIFCSVLFCSCLYFIPFVFIAVVHSHYLYTCWYLDILLASRLGRGLLTELYRNNSNCPYEYFMLIVYNALLYDA